MLNIPDIVQVVPHDNYTVSVYFADGKITVYDAKPKLDTGIFQVLREKNLFMNRCMILNDTLAWDIVGDKDRSRCIDIDPVTLYNLDHVSDKRDYASVCNAFQ